MCVSQNTLGCTGLVKSSIERTFLLVKSVISHVCEPPVEEEPSMACQAVAGETMVGVCDVSGATACMYKVYSELMCDRPDYKNICP